MGSKMKKLVILLSLAAIFVIYAFYISSKNTSKPGEHPEKEAGEVSKLITRDLDASYPKTPREVVKLYSRIISCYYKEKYNEDELKQLAEKAQKLMDDELKSHNSFDEYYSNLKEDIENYKKTKKVISTYVIQSSVDIEYKTFKDEDYAFVNCIYFTKGKEGATRVPERYVLRKSIDGKWKIVYWEIVEEEESDYE